MRRHLVVLLVFAVVGALAAPAAAQSSERSAPSSMESLRLDEPIEGEGIAIGGRLDPALVAAEGPVLVTIRLTEAAAGQVAGAAGRAQKTKVAAQQAGFASAVAAAGGAVLGTVQTALNAVFVEVDGAALASLAGDSRVASIRPTFNYELDLSETVPYIGATAVQNLGFDGTGVDVAVLDSGIDYTHADLGGPGTAAAYLAAYGTGPADPRNTTTDDLFPTAKVVGGFDFVGEQWTGATGTPPLLPDPDPIDFEGHGTHVADIIGGDRGVAPGVNLWAFKVCSAVSTACSGQSMVQAIDRAMDPNGDGDTSDHLDVINMSIGSPYGQPFDDDTAFATEAATRAGVLVVASSGNSSDKPYVTGTPGAAASALSVAQTQVPSAIEVRMEVRQPADKAGFYTAVFQDWSKPLTAEIAGAVQYGNGAGGNLNGCAAFPAGSLTGKIVAVDRGVCAFSQKVQNIEAGGGVLGIIMLVAPGAPFPGGFGGGALPQIPAYMIDQAAGNILRAGNAVVSFDPAEGTPLVGTLVGSSSRGPSNQYNLIKPEIGAPGASISAEAGTGTGRTPFGGTSGAAPMVTGAAALLLDANPTLTPPEVKARLINTAETDIETAPGTGPAPITRIGGGEVRVDRALAAGAAAWDAATLSGALSFGFVDATEDNRVVTKTVTVRNYTAQAIQYSIVPAFRDPTDASSGAVRVIAPNTVNVRANGTASFQVEVQIRGAALATWPMNSGGSGADPASLDAAEFDGYLRLDAAGTANDLHLPWHVLPRRSGDVRLQGTGNAVNVRNNGAGSTLVETYTLLGSNGNLPSGAPGTQSPVVDFHHVGYTTFPVPAGFCLDDPSFLLAFAVNTWERQTHSNAPALFEFDLDTDQDGTFDYAVYNFDLSLAGARSDGRNVVWAQNLQTGQASAWFFTDHETNSANTVLYVCAEQIGLSGTDLGQPIDAVALAVDAYFQNVVTDFFADLTIVPGGERYLGVFDGTAVGATVLPSRTTADLNIIDFGPGDGSDAGLLLLYRGGAPAGNEAAAIALAP